MDKVLILTILDESGSMYDKKQDVIGGFNLFLDKKKKHEFPCRMMVTKFNTVCVPIKWKLDCGHEDQIAPIKDIPHLNETTYTPGGWTALFDAVANTVKEAEILKKDSENVLCLIITDGEENSSHETTYEQIKDIISAKSKQGWKFIYIGQQPEKWAKQFNIPMTQTIIYHSTDPTLSFMTAFYYASSCCFTPYGNFSLQTSEKEAKKYKNDWGRK